MHTPTFILTALLASAGLVEEVVAHPKLSSRHVHPKLSSRQDPSRFNFGFGFGNPAPAPAPVVPDQGQPDEGAAASEPPIPDQGQPGEVTAPPEQAVPDQSQQEEVAVPETPIPEQGQQEEGAEVPVQDGADGEPIPTPDQGIPDQGTPDQGQGAPDQGNQDQGNQDQVIPEQGIPEQGTPDQGTPDQGNQDQGTPDQGNQDQGNQDQAQIILNPDLFQIASTLTGQEPGTEGIKEGQAFSATDDQNFINFCEGQTITNGMQITDGSCNGIPMGRIPSVANMISAIIINPKHSEVINPDETFNINIQTSNLRAGNFVNPTTNYYTAPQDLDAEGKIIGHCHVTVQEIGDFESGNPPDPSTFAFFKGIDDAGNGEGLLTAEVTGGLAPGVYRVCTMIAAQNHQPVNMPVAQRGAQDDCTKFEVRGNGNAPPDGTEQNDKDASDNQDEMGVIRNGGQANEKTEEQKQQRGRGRGRGRRGRNGQRA